MRGHLDLMKRLYLLVAERAVIETHVAKLAVEMRLRTEADEQGDSVGNIGTVVALRAIRKLAVDRSILEKLLVADMIFLLRKKFARNTHSASREYLE